VRHSDATRGDRTRLIQFEFFLRSLSLQLVLFIILIVFEQLLFQQLVERLLVQRVILFEQLAGIIVVFVRILVFFELRWTGPGRDPRIARVASATL